MCVCARVCVCVCVGATVRANDFQVHQVIQALAGTGKDERGLVERSLSSSREVRMPRSNKV